MSALRYDLASSASVMPWRNCERSITRFMRDISTEMNAATAPSRNAGAATLPIMRESCSIEGVSSGVLFTPQDRRRYCSGSTFAAMSGARLTL